MRVTDVFLAFPGLVLAVVITAVLGKGLDKVMIAIAIVGWPTYARLLRGDILSVKQRDYVEAAYNPTVMPAAASQPEVLDAVRTGQLSTEQAALVSRGANADPTALPKLLDVAARDGLTEPLDLAAWAALARAAA